MLRLFAGAMNPCLVGFGLAPSQPNVRGVPTGKLPSGKTCAVPSALLHVSRPPGNGRPVVPADTRHVARASEKPLGFSHGECHRGVRRERTAYHGARKRRRALPACATAFLPGPLLHP